MSSVSRNNENDRVRRLREEYETREAQSEKKKNSEVKRLKQKHAEELSDISEAYDNKMTSTREKSQDEAKKSERRHQEQIHDISKMHRTQLRKKLEDANEVNQLVKANSKKEIEETERRSQVQRQDSANKSRAIINEKDRQFSDTFDRISGETQEKFKEQTEKFNNLRQKEVEHYNEVNAQDKQRNFEKIKRIDASYRDKLSNLERNKNNEITKLITRNKDNEENLSAQQSGELGVKDQLQRTERERLKARYDDKIEDYQKENNEINEDYRNTLSDRTTRQVTSKNSQIRDLKQRSVSDRANQERLHKTEKENIIRDYEKKLDLVNETRELELGQVREENADKKLKQYEQTSDILSAANKRFKQDLQLKTHVGRMDRANLIRDYNDKISAVDDRAERRIEKIHNSSLKNNSITEQNYQQTAEKLKELFDQRIDKNRDMQITQQLEMKEQAQTRLREIERSYAKKLNFIVGQKNDEIEKLKNQLDSLERSSQNAVTQKMKEHFKTTDKEKQAIVDKYERYIDRVKENYSEEIDRLRERHRRDITEAVNKQAEVVKNLRKG